MANEQIKSVFRMRKRHTPDTPAKAEPADGLRLINEQSVRDAILAALVTVILFAVLWAMVSTLRGSIFPWMTLLLGVVVGLVIRRAGRGIDWRFPLIAIAITLAGSLFANVIVAAAFTAEELDTSTIAILRAATNMTWPVFFDEALSPVDVIYALFAAGIAAFYSQRRLNRTEFMAIRKWEEQQDKPKPASDGHQ
ncbi:MAG: hypothetical protein QNK16_04040 [Woeseiaceae bacterium]|nr:hypothetical protein [Woeseiaceae bacterium]MDX2607530.1 hypothetical protein [Woeseiaceae bacterium]